MTKKDKYVFFQGWLCCKLLYGSRKISRLENKTESWFEKGNILICYCFNPYNVWYLACPSGYFGINCFATCPYAFFGRLCTHQCNCSKSKCDFINGCKRYGRAMIIFSFFGFWFWFIFWVFFTLNTLSLIKDHEQLHIMQVLRIKSLLFGVVFHNIANNEWYKYILYCFLQIISIKPQFQTKPIVCRWKSTYTDKKTEKKNH